MEVIQKDHSPDELETLYDKRFSGREAYRRNVWRALTPDCAGRFILAGGAVLDLYGTWQHVDPEVCLFQQDWSLAVLAVA
jgi:hypothetical protein